LRSIAAGPAKNAKQQRQLVWLATLWVRFRRSGGGRRLLIDVVRSAWRVLSAVTHAAYILVEVSLRALSGVLDAAETIRDAYDFAMYALTCEFEWSVRRRGGVRECTDSADSWQAACQQG